MRKGDTAVRKEKAEKTDEDSVMSASCQLSPAQRSLAARSADSRRPAPLATSWQTLLSVYCEGIEFMEQTLPVDAYT